MSAGGVPVRLERPARLEARANDFSRRRPVAPGRAGHADRVGAGSAIRGGAPLNGRVRRSARRPGRPRPGAPAWPWTSAPRATSPRRGRAAAASTRPPAPPRSTTARSSGASCRRSRSCYTEARFDGTLLVVDYLTASWQGGGIEGWARVPRGLLEPAPGARRRPGPRRPQRERHHPRGAAPVAARPTWSTASTLGSRRRSGSTWPRAEVSGITGTLVLAEASLTAAGVPISQARPAHMSIANGVLYFDDVAFSAGEPVMFGGSVAFGDPITLDMTITGMPGLRPLSVLSPQLSRGRHRHARTCYLTGAGRAAADHRPDRHRRRRDRAARSAGDCLGHLRPDPVRGRPHRRSPGFYGSVNGGSLDASGRVSIDGLQVTGGEIDVPGPRRGGRVPGERRQRDRRPADLRAGPRATSARRCCAATSGCCAAPIAAR